MQMDRQYALSRCTSSSGEFNAGHSFISHTQAACIPYGCVRLLEVGEITTVMTMDACPELRDAYDLPPMSLLV